MKNFYHKTLDLINNFTRKTGYIPNPDRTLPRLSCLTVSSSELVPAEMDGEIIPAAKEFKITVIPQALKVLVPPSLLAVKKPLIIREVKIPEF